MLNLAISNLNISFLQRLAQGQTKSWYNGMLLKNKEKNRYINLLPCKFSTVFILKIV